MRRNGSAPSASALVAPPERKPAPELDASARKALVDEAAGKSTRRMRHRIKAALGWHGELWLRQAPAPGTCYRSTMSFRTLSQRDRPAIPTALSSGRIVAAGLTQPSFELRHAGFGRFAGRGFAREACLCFLPRLAGDVDVGAIAKVVPQGLDRVGQRGPLVIGFRQFGTVE